MGLSEFELIHEITKNFMETPGILKPGDDCSILDLAKVFKYRSSDKLAFTKDLLVEDVHFRTSYFSAPQLARKAIAVNLSDLAAVGAMPLIILVGIALPKSFDQGFIKAFYREIKNLSLKFNFTLAGGDTVSSKVFAISITAIGRLKGEAILRSGAVARDDIWVSGEVGGASLGLEILENLFKKKASTSKLNPSHKQQYKQLNTLENKLAKRLVEPKAQLELGQALQKKRLATSLIDLSDGLLQDLGHICEQSAVQAVLDFSKIPIDKAFKKLSKNPYAALLGGEDYELLFTASPSNRVKIEALAKSLRIKISRIGSISNFNKKSQKEKIYFIEKENRLVSANSYINQTAEGSSPQFRGVLGFDHFR